MATTPYRLDGGSVHGIDDLYEQFNRILMSDRDWRLGASLDGLNDVLHDVRGADGARVRFEWVDHEHSRQALGSAETARWLRGKLERPDVFDQVRMQRQLDELLEGIGKTYFELVLEVFGDHPQIELVLL